MTIPEEFQKKKKKISVGESVSWETQAPLGKQQKNLLKLSYRLSQEDGLDRCGEQVLRKKTPDYPVGWLPGDL